MNKEHFDERLKIICFRSITNQLLEQSLITQEEFGKIQKRLRKMEADLVAAKPCKSSHPRKLTVVH